MSADSVLRYHVRLLVAFVTLSVAGNAISAGADDLPVVARMVIMSLFPVILLVASHSAIQVARSFTGWVRVTTTMLSAVIALGAFVLSFVELRHVAEMAGVPAGWLSVVAALVVDVMIVQTTVVAMFASHRISDEVAGREVAEVAGPVGEQSATTEVAAPAAESAPADHVAEVVDQPAIDPVVAELAANHPATVVADPVAEVADQDSDQEVGPVVGPVVEVHTEHLVVADSVPATTEVAESGVVVDQPEVAGPVADEPATEAVADQVEESVADHPASHPAAPVVDPVVAEVADRVRETTATTKTTEEIVQVLELAESGLSQRAIAAEVGIDRSVISRLIKAAEAEPRPVLAAVN